ncbi:MAG TPA: TetR family transcriptional regulator [Burkholderiaceae bacterium]
MARRTKEEAQATRAHLLDAAELLFHARGVARTSLGDIAKAAGVTRGAVYWHFRDKADVFNAMLDRVTLPLEDACNSTRASTCDLLENLRTGVVDFLRKLVTDERTRRVFEIAIFKAEYVDDMQAAHLRHARACANFRARIESDLRQIARGSGVTLPMPAAMAAMGLHALLDGLFQNWILEEGNFDLVKVGRKTMDAYFAGLGLSCAAGAVAANH